MSTQPTVVGSGLFLDLARVHTLGCADMLPTLIWPNIIGRRSDKLYFISRLCFCIRTEHKKINGRFQPSSSTSLIALKRQDQWNINANAILVPGIGQFLDLAYVNVLGLPTLNRLCSIYRRRTIQVNTSCSICSISGSSQLESFTLFDINNLLFWLYFPCYACLILVSVVCSFPVGQSILLITMH